MKKYLTALAFFPKITYTRHKNLLQHFTDPADIWQAELEDLLEAKLEENIIYEFLKWRDLQPPEYFTNLLAQKNIYTLSVNEPGYPRLLKEINDPPHTLFVRGNLKDINTAVAIVGTRQLSSYGRQACLDIVSPLAQKGITIVSGLALGIDGLAHEATLQAGGKTVAVLGGSVEKNYIYPSAHNNLAEKIIESGGALVSEYPPGFLPTVYSFPARNRIIAGLCLGTLVIEAPVKSGSLITAYAALDYNREVFSVPHNITSASGEGCNKLLKLGAHVTLTANDILEALDLKITNEEIKEKTKLQLNEQEAVIYKTLSREPKHINQIIKETGLTSQEAGGTITMLEIRGIVKDVGGKMYVI
jgi:DNA processing protein